MSLYADHIERQIAKQSQVERSLREVPAVGEFTPYYAQKTVLGMVRIVRDYAPETTAVAAWEQVLDAVIRTGQQAPTEAHRHDARLMYRAARSYWMGAKQGW